MNQEIRKMLEMTDMIHRPIPLDESEMAETRLAQKPVLKSRLLDDMESLDTWEAVTPWAKIELSDTYHKEGSHSLRFSAPTNLNGWKRADSHMYNEGRIYAVPAALRKFDREDWRAYNRLSAWVYPSIPGMKSITLRIQLFNDGEVKVPDRFIRDGAHNMSLKNDCWNYVVLEMPYLDRDAVTGVAFEYDMVGHENDAADEVVFYCDQLKLEEVECDVYEGWIPADDRISYSHSGYQPGACKSAICSAKEPKTFRIIDAKTGKVVLKKAIEDRKTEVGELRVMDFSEVTTEGDYILVAGELSTRTFPIRHDAWESSVWKALNFYLVLRCGYEVPGKHRKCHEDMLLKHGDKAIVCDGGWHDAGDLAQGLTNTCDGTRALFALAKSLKNTGNDELFTRVLEEAKWGLDYILKMRFGDGYRATYSSCSIWSDGVIGTHDDVKMEAANSPLSNFDSACAEAAGAELFFGVDDDYARYCVKIAEEDFAFGLADTGDIATLTTGKAEVEIMVVSAGASAAAMLYRLTGKESYREAAKRFGEKILACQEQSIPEGWKVPITGYFYENSEKKLIWHHNHHAASCFPDLALRDLCETFPEDADYMKWYYGIVLSGQYYAALLPFTAPYGVVPAGVYRADEAEKYPQEAIASHPMGDAQMIEEYRGTVENGFKIADETYVKVYPVWFSFRGNYNVLLSEGKAMSSAAQVRNNYALSDAALKQYEWIVGKNPMAQSTMYGEGHDYIQLYAVQPGQTVGALSVGMESHFNRDEPYWPQVNNATYKEVWVGAINKWVWDMADNLTPAVVSGYLDVRGGEPVVFTRKQSGESYEVYTHPRTGYYSITLPAGEYTMSCKAESRSLTVISGKRYEIDGDLREITVAMKQNADEIELTISGRPGTVVTLKAENLSGLAQEVVLPESGKIVVSAKVVQTNRPFVGLAIPDGALSQAKEFLNL